jgi:predicted NUDIX family NTP pyrophosphohydrolase
MSKKSAGLLMYHWKEQELEVLLVHPGGPYWSNKDNGAWSIPKGEFNLDEDSLEVAKREFTEETGFPVSGEFKKLNPIRQKSGKVVYVWAIEGFIDASKIVSNIFTMEWPPISGHQQAFPEVDKARWFTIEKAKEKINSGQIALLDELKSILI